MARPKAMWPAAFVALLALPAALAAVTSPVASAQSMAVQPDGKIVLAGNSTQWLGGWGGGMLRFNPDGRLDRGFGAGGGLIDFRVREGFGPIAVKPSGRIVATVGSGLRMVELLPDGRPSSGFGSGGIAGGPPLPNGWRHGPEIPRAVLIGPGESVVVGGETLSHTSVDEHSFSEALLFGADGSFESQLGLLSRGGPLATLESARLTDLLARPDGSLIASAQAKVGGHGAALLARFVPGASPYDGSFADGQGLLGLDPFPQSEAPAGADAVAVDGAGLVLAGTAGGKILLARLDAEGTLDPAFGDGGIVSAAPAGALEAGASDVAVQPDGEILVAGRVTEPCAGANSYRSCPNLFVARFHSDGALDPSFGSGGYTLLRANGEAELAMRPAELALLAGGDVLLGGPLGDEDAELAVARLRSDGTLDPGFGDAGIAAVAPCQADPKVLRRIGCLSRVAVRFLCVGSRPRRFGAVVHVAATNPLDPLHTVRIDLPSWLEARPAGGPEPRVVAANGRRGRVKVYPRHVHVVGLGGPTSATIRLPRGFFVGSKRGTRRPRRPFRVDVWLADGTSSAFEARLSQPSRPPR